MIGGFTETGATEARPSVLPSTRQPRWIVRAVLVYGLAVVFFTWPLARQPLSVLASVEGPGDSYLNLWVLGWDLQTLTTHPGALLTGRIFDANIFFPALGTLAYSDHLLLQAVALTPIYLLTHDLVFCYNVLLVLSLLACALAMHAYIREVTGSEWGAWTAGIAWGYAPFHFGHLTHIQLQALYFLPLAFLFLHRLIETRRTSDACLLGAMLGLQAVGSVYYGVIGLLGLLCGAVALLASREGRPLALIARRGLLAAIIAALIVAPVVYQYWRVQRREGFGRSLYEAAHGSAAMTSYLQAPPTNFVYGWIGMPGRSASGDAARNPAEQRLFPGCALMLLAAAGFWYGRRTRATRPLVRAFTLVLITGFVLSLGPSGIRPIYTLLDRIVFGFHAIRAPARFAVLVLFGLAGLSGLGVGELARKYSRFQAGIVLGAVGLLTFEYANVPITYVAAPQLGSSVGNWLRGAPETGAVLYLPFVLDAGETTSVMVQSLAHGRPIVNGYSGQRPAFLIPLMEIIDHFPSAESVSTLHALGVRFVVSRTPLDIDGLPLVERARLDEGVIYELRWTPETEARLRSADAFVLPPPALIPFSAGEIATYSIVWTSGPVAVPAGTAMLRVGEASQLGAKYTFQVTGSTAPWMSRFFRADDVFLTEVDGQLRPVIAEQHLREGHRTLDRRMVFDRSARVVRLQQPDRADIALPIPAQALDPVSAFYYLRSLPLTAGTTVRVPLDDSGRNLLVDLRSVGLETIRYQGAQIQTLRVEPQVYDQGLQPIGYRLALWLSVDARRIPVRITVEGLSGVGSVQMDLVSLSSGR